MAWKMCPMTGSSHQRAGITHPAGQPGRSGKAMGAKVILYLDRYEGLVLGAPMRPITNEKRTGRRRRGRETVARRGTVPVEMEIDRGKLFFRTVRNTQQPALELLRTPGFPRAGDPPQRDDRFVEQGPAVTCRSDRNQF